MWGCDAWVGLLLLTRGWAPPCFSPGCFSGFPAVSTRSWAPVTPRSASAGPRAQTRDSIRVFPTVATLNAPSSDGRHRRWLFSLTLGITRFQFFSKHRGVKHRPAPACLACPDHRTAGLAIPATSFPFWALCACFRFFTDDSDLTANSGTSCLPFSSCVHCNHLLSSTAFLPVPRDSHCAPPFFTPHSRAR